MQLFRWEFNQNKIQITDMTQNVGSSARTVIQDLATLIQHKPNQQQQYRNVRIAPALVALLALLIPSCKKNGTVINLFQFSDKNHTNIEHTHLFLLAAKL